LKMHDNIFSCTRNWVPFALLSLSILLVYSNTFNASWQLDDYPNITGNSKLHVKDISPASIYETFFAHPESGKKLYRPIACLTFAINWYFGKENVIGYHIVNNSIHLLTAFILFLTILNLFRSPNLKDKYQGSKYFITLLTATLWAINPIQTQAVTYIVQRMASMATMFYVLGIYFYIKGRTNNSRLISVFSYMGCFLSFVFALGSKENTATLPLALLLVEIVFFQKLHIPGTRRKILWVSVGTLLFFILTGPMLFMKGDLLFFLNGYENRSFTLLERLMTEPRILVYYITQIFYPVPNRLSIVHDITISTSLFEPWTTFPAILIIFLLIGIGISQIKKRPIVAFGILFFFLNHLIESTILPLELIFEHRNYLPSLFLFFPVSVGLIWIIDYYHKTHHSMYLIIISFVTLLLMGLGSATYIRNMAWATEKSLWEDAMKKAPGRARPTYNFAKHYLKKTGHYDQALLFYERAFHLKASKPKYSQALCLNGMASIYYLRHEYDEVIKLCKKALKIYPGFQIIRLNLIRALIKMENLDEALSNVDVLIEKYENNSALLNLKGFILIKHGKYAEALLFLNRAHDLAPRNKIVLLNIGVSLSLAGDYADANKIFQQVLQIFPDDIALYLYLIENSIKAEDLPSVDRYLTRLSFLFDRVSIESELNSLSEEHFLIPFSRELITPVVHKRINGTG